MADNHIAPEPASEPKSVEPTFGGVPGGIWKVDMSEYPGRHNPGYQGDPNDPENSGSPADAEEEDKVDREQWSNPVEFLLSCVAMSVGLGNIWRFPYQAFKNGGGAFLIPYLIVLTVIGRPIYFLELSIGQFSNYGQTKVWKVSPIFKGVGWGSMYGTVCVVITYACVMGLTVFYFFASMSGTLPWVNCNEEYLGNDTQFEGFFCNSTDPTFIYQNLTDGFEGEAVRSNTSVSEVYFLQRVLRQLPDIDEGIGWPLWDLSLCLLFSWVVIWAALIKGVSSAGKVAYFTALFPYAVLLVMLIRGVTLTGAWEGIRYFLEPQWDMMLKPDVWYAAVSQCFFSLSTGFGSIIMFSSYNDFNHNIYRDAWILSVMDTFTSLLAGITVFSVLGNLAYLLEVNVPDVARGGPGLTFISFAQALGTFPAPQVFSILFYLMLFTLGTGSATALTGGIVTTICDQMPNLKKPMVTTVVSIMGFLVGLIFCTPGGQAMSDLVSYFGADFVIYVMAILEVSAFAYVYGVGNLINDIEFMLGVRLGIYWKFCWVIAIPIGLTGILIYALATMERLTFGDGVQYPDEAIFMGWTIAAGALLIIVFMAFHAITSRKEGNTFFQKFKIACRPTADWGPRSAKRRREWEQFKAAKKSN